VVVHPTVALEGAQSTVVAETLAATVKEKRPSICNFQYAIYICCMHFRKCLGFPQLHRHLQKMVYVFDNIQILGILEN